MYFDNGFANKTRLVDMKCLIRKHGVLMCSPMLALHAFSGCYSTSPFIRKGKITARKTLVKHIFGTLGETDGVPGGSQTELEKFICCMYGKPLYKDVCLRMPLTLTVTTIYDDGDDDFEENSHVIAK